MEQNGQNGELSQPLQFFVYLVSFLSLWFVAFGSGSILFQIINKNFPDLASIGLRGGGSGFDQSAIKFGIAALFIAIPLFFSLMRFITRSLREGKISEDSKSRKWITYIVLFFAAATILGDLIALIFNFLEGDIAVRFLLKVLVIIAIAGSIFGYYFWNIKRKDMVGNVYAINSRAGYSAAALAVAVFIGGFFFIDSPVVAREKKIDQNLVFRLQGTDSSVRGYHSQSSALPQTLDDLKKTAFAISDTSGIEYKKTGELTFQLCANFLRSNLEDETTIDFAETKSWEHRKGRMCFDREVLEDIKQFPPIK